jgi:hypothetical protein
LVVFKPSTTSVADGTGAATVARVRSTNLTLQQLATLDARLGRESGYLRRLVARMDARGFPSRDPLRERTQNALLTLEQLREEIRRIQHRQAHAFDKPPRNTDKRVSPPPPRLD